MIETVYHMVVVDPGVYQDRAGVLFGPFSPIYGFGAVLMTIALNRFYKANPIIIFLVSAVIGGLFEFFVSWFMQTAFGAVAWNYSGMKIFGIPLTPLPSSRRGARQRRSCSCGAPWGLCGSSSACRGCSNSSTSSPGRSATRLPALCTVLMLVNGVMTLQALDCWFERVSGVQPNSPVEEFYAEHFDDAYMEHRFQSMTITPENSSRVDSSAVAK